MLKSLKKAILCMLCKKKNILRYASLYLFIDQFTRLCSVSSFLGKREPNLGFLKSHVLIELIGRVRSKSGNIREITSFICPLYIIPCSPFLHFLYFKTSNSIFLFVFQTIDFDKILHVLKKHFTNSFSIFSFTVY